MPSSKKDNVPLSKKIFFSGISGAIATTCIYPLDITKTKLQDQKGVGAARQYKGPLDCAMKILRKSGIRGMYQGWPPNVILVMPEKALKLTLNDYFRKQLRASSLGGGAGELPASLQLLAGGMAGFCQVSATNPMELLKIQGATMAEKVKTGELKQKIGYMQLIKNLGVSGVYTGVLATLTRDVPFSMVYFAGYGQAKEMMEESSTNFGGSEAFLAGAISGTFAAGITTPIDVLKTRVHSQAKPSKLPLAQFAAREVELIRTNYSWLMKNEGFGALFKGVIPRCLIISPLFAITMTCYETFQDRFG